MSVEKGRSLVSYLISPIFVGPSESFWFDGYSTMGKPLILALTWGVPDEIPTNHKNLSLTIPCCMLSLVNWQDEASVQNSARTPCCVHPLPMRAQSHCNVNVEGGMRPIYSHQTREFRRSIESLAMPMPTTGRHRIWKFQWKVGRTHPSTGSLR